MKKIFVLLLLLTGVSSYACQQDAKDFLVSLYIKPNQYVLDHYNSGYYNHKKNVVCICNRNYFKDVNLKTLKVKMTTERGVDIIVDCFEGFIPKYIPTSDDKTVKSPD